MAKKKKTASNPARGFATTSTPSKPRPTETPPASASSSTPSSTPTSTSTSAPASTNQSSSATPGPSSASSQAQSKHQAQPTSAKSSSTTTHLSPEEYAAHLEEENLQLLVEKLAPIVKRESQRQVARLETNRRLLRSTADTIPCSKWLPPPLLQQILDLLVQEGRFSASHTKTAIATSSGTPAGANANSEKVTEETSIIRLWTLERTLQGLYFPPHRVEEAVQYVVDLGLKVSSSVHRDSLWGLEEALSYLARECDPAELPLYDLNPQQEQALSRGRPLSSLLETDPTPAPGPPSQQPLSKPIPSVIPGTNTPRLPSPDRDRDIREQQERQQKQAATPSVRKNTLAKAHPSGSARPIVATFDEEIEAEDLFPQYLAAKTRLFQIERPLVTSAAACAATKRSPAITYPDDDVALEAAKLRAKLAYIEGDVLFEKQLAELEWKTARLSLEQGHVEDQKRLRIIKAVEAKAEKERKEKERKEKELREKEQQTTANSDEPVDEISSEAARITAELLADEEEEGSDGDDGITGLFSSLAEEANHKQNPTPPANPTGVTVRDIGPVTGLDPSRMLLDSCRSRDSSVKCIYTIVSDNPFVNRCQLAIHWSKPQYIAAETTVAGVTVTGYSDRTQMTMTAIATPTKEQAKAFISAAALFHIFPQSATSDEKRLSGPWRALYKEWAQERQDQIDKQDRVAIKKLLERIRDKQNLELEEGIILTGASRGRLAASRSSLASGVTASERGSSSRSSTPVAGLTASSSSASISTSSSSPSSSSSANHASSVHRPADESLRAAWAAKTASPQYNKMLVSRQQLPMWQFRSTVLEAVDQNPIVIVCGETGCGKSTQVPAFLLEHQLSQGRPCKIFCTEPRRISAVSLARRVSEELGENRQDLGTSRSLVGYSIRLEANVVKETRLIFATTGIVMRMLEGSNDLSDVTHLVLDEVHERSIDSDFLLIVLKRLIRRRPDLKVVLMSATVDADRFSSYLGGAPVLSVPGRTFPVQTYFLEDAVELVGYKPEDFVSEEAIVDLDDLDDVITDPNSASQSAANGKSALRASLAGKYSSTTISSLFQMDEHAIEYELIVRLLQHIATSEAYRPFSQAVLVFLPGLAEIRALNNHILGHPAFMHDWLVYPLHSSIATEDQESAFLVPPPGMRKIVLATNIAETGITIPDITCVIDTGKHKEMRYDERRQLSRLIDTFISRANAKQRRGRAGRVQEGLCFHMFTKHRHDSMIADHQTPEMLRLSLQDLAIRVKMCKLGGIEESLMEALDPPAAKNIRRAIDALVDVRALTSSEELTALGRQLAHLPLDVFLGKLVLLGTVFQCLDMAVTVAAILSSKSPFSAPFGQRAQANAARQTFRRGDSDLLTVYNAYLTWRRICQSGTGKDFAFCRKFFLNQATLLSIEDLKGQLISSLVDSGFLALTAEERANLNRIRFASNRGRGRQQPMAFYELPYRVNLYSEVDSITASVIGWSFYPKVLVQDKGWRSIGTNQPIYLHPTSVNRGHPEIKYLSYYHIMQSKMYYGHETTALDAFSMALLCGDVRYDLYAGTIILDGNRAKFSVADWKSMLAIKALRSRLRELLQRSFKQPGQKLSAQQERWMDVWQQIFQQDESQ